MGWASGSDLAEEIWNAVRKHIPDKKRKKVANEICDAFEAQDCDTLYECDQLMKDSCRSMEDEDEY